MSDAQSSAALPDPSILALVAEQTTNGVVITDHYGRIEWVNRSFTRLTGYTLAEAYGLKPGDFLQGPDTDPEVVARISVALAHGQSCSEEILNYHKDGTPYWVSMQISPVFDEEGRLVRFIAIESDVTARRSAEEALRRSEAYLRIVVSSLPLVLFATDRDGRLTLAEGKGLHDLGIDPSSAVGRSVFEIYRDVPHIISNMQRALVGESFTTLVQAEGRLFETRYSPIYEVRDEVVGVIGVAMDMSEQARAAATLRATSTRLETLIGSLQAAVLVEDEMRLIRLTNEAFCRMFEIDQAPEQLIGVDCDLALYRYAHLFDDPRAAALRIEQILNERAPVAAEPVAMADGRILERDYVPIFVDGDYHGHFWQYRDVTERVRDTEELVRAKEAAEAATRAKSAFLATISHEIRTPLNAVIGMTSLLLDTVLTGEQRHYAETIHTSGDMLLTLISDILDFSKIESGYMQLEHQPFDLRTCVEETLDLLTPRAAEKELDLTAIIAPTVPTCIVGDVGRVRQVLVNLVANAVKFTERGEVVVSVESHDLGEDPGINAPDARQAEISIAVHDTGIGIPPDRVDNLFQSFSQVDTSTTRRYGGTGLGLAISKRLIEIMGGTISVDSVMGLGSTFTATFWATYVPGPKRKVTPHSSLNGRSLLIVEPRMVIRQSISEQARAWGLQPMGVGSAAEALEALREGGPFDLAIIDAPRPDLDGLALARAIRGLPGPVASLPLILLTTIRAAAAVALPEGVFAAVLTRPVRPSTLRWALQAALGDAVLPASTVSPPVAVPTLTTHNPLRILLAEDNVVNQQMVLRMLERLGYRADIATNGLEVLEALQDRIYDVVLMDVQMPEMDGLDVTRRIRATILPDQQPHIIAMTANATTGDRELCLASGMDDYISKPMRRVDVEAALQRALQHWQEKPPENAVGIVGKSELAMLLAESGDAACELRMLLTEFQHEGEEDLDRMRTALDNWDSERLGRAAHRLKGSSAALDALLLAEVCDEIERHAAADALEEVALLIEQAEQRYRLVSNELEGLLTRLEYSCD